MTDNPWSPWPLAYRRIATPRRPLPPSDILDILPHLLENGAGLAGGLASATLDPELDQQDAAMRCACWPRPCMGSWASGRNGSGLRCPTRR
jgi:hypothetical protein